MITPHSGCNRCQGSSCLHSCCSFLALQLHWSLFRLAPQIRWTCGNGYDRATCQHGPLSIAIFLSRHLILLIKMRVQSRHTCNQHAITAVSDSLSCLTLTSSPLPAWEVDPLSPGGMYIGPSSPDSWAWCKCSTVAYSLLSACGACQGGSWYTYVSLHPSC